LPITKNEETTMTTQLTEETRLRLGEETREVLKALHKVFDKADTGAWVQRSDLGTKLSGRFNTVLANMVGEGFLDYFRAPSTRRVSYCVKALGWELLRSHMQADALTLYDMLGTTTAANEHRAKLAGPIKLSCRSCSGRLDKDQRRDAEHCRACLEGRGKGSKRLVVAAAKALVQLPLPVTPRAPSVPVPTFSQLVETVSDLTRQLIELRKDIHGLRSAAGMRTITRHANGHGQQAASILTRLEGLVEELRHEERGQ
jgi:hypothetical protein